MIGRHLAFSSTKLAFFCDFGGQKGHFKSISTFAHSAAFLLALNLVPFSAEGCYDSRSIELAFVFSMVWSIFVDCALRCFPPFNSIAATRKNLVRAGALHQQTFFLELPPIFFELFLRLRTFPSSALALDESPKRVNSFRYFCCTIKSASEPLFFFMRSARARFLAFFRPSTARMMLFFDWNFLPKLCWPNSGDLIPLRRRICLRTRSSGCY
jgi:hypothetical protein